MYRIGIDAGNSRIKFGLFRNENLVEVQVINATDAALFNPPVGWEKTRIESIGLSSVNSSINNLMKTRFSLFYDKKVSIITPSDCGIPLKIKNPEGVGIDRVLNCKAAIKLFGSPVIVVDIGTAITIDIATKKDGFKGGCIMPGGELWTKALMTTSLIKSSRMVRAIFPGKNTDEAISIGIKYGIPGTINSVLSVALRKYPSAKVVLTGGGCTANICRKISFKYTYRKYLTLEGVGLVLGKFHKGL